MSKFAKALSNPRGFIVDAVKNKRHLSNLKSRVAAAKGEGRKVAILIGFSSWKTWMREYLSEYEVIFVGHSPRVKPHLLEAIGEFGDVEVFVWSYKFPQELRRICKDANIPLTMVEDGFIRSFGLGVKKSAPLSLVFDQSAMHFDRSTASDLEQFLSTHDFAADTELMARADAMIDNLVDARVSKYNGLGDDVDLRTSLGIEPNQKCVLVLGQVEDDLSLKHGLEGEMSGNDLVLVAAMENPDAVIIYRPHPESRAVSKKHYSNPKDVTHVCHVVDEDVSLHACFDAANEVYTMTSLAGFEALIRGIKVKTFGLPFYAGWGATTDVDSRAVLRTARLTPREIFAAAYILYPRYWHPVTKAEITPEEGLSIITALGKHIDRVSHHSEQRAIAAQWEDGRAQMQIEHLPAAG